MFLSDRRSALKSASTITIVVLVFVLLFTSESWHTTDDEISILSSPHSWPDLTEPTLELTIVTEIPKKIWYKLGLPGMTPRARELVDSRLNKNPNYKVEFMTDLSVHTYVKDKFAHRPDIVEAFLPL
jgi:hypothetical protein